jgi:hypothetical protein
MAHNSKRFVTVIRADEPRRLKRSRHRTREDRRGGLHVARDQIGTTLRYSRRTASYEWVGCPACIALLTNPSLGDALRDCRQCERLLEQRWALQTWAVPAQCRREFTRTERLEFPVVYRDAGYHYF